MCDIFCCYINITMIMVFWTWAYDDYVKYLNDKGTSPENRCTINISK